MYIKSFYDNPCEHTRADRSGLVDFRFLTKTTDAVFAAIVRFANEEKLNFNGKGGSHEHESMPNQ